ncbi:hypothetical protein DL991_10615 [Amycolatopsis sp. WAC 01375]|nr:hypothetical protein DL991_10615 [Amycolatopsis sp. WAC 01375]
MIGRRNDRDSYDDDLATLMYNTATYIRKFLSTPDVRDVALPTQMVDFLDKVMVVCANPWARPASEALRSAMADNPVDLMQHPNMPERRLSLMKRLKASTPSFIMLSADAWKIILILIAIISILLGRRGLSDLPIPN